MFSAFSSTNNTRKESHLQRYQARQLSDRQTQLESSQCYSRCRFRNGQTVSRSQNKATYSISWTQIIIWHSSLHEYQYTFGQRTITKRRSWSFGPCFHVLFAWWPSMARFESCNKQAEIRKDWWKETNNCHQRSMWRPTRFVLHIPSFSVTNTPSEEFNKYLSYVRNLGFEDTPDYDFLRDLFTQALKNTGEVEDGEYDWMKLNGGRGWEAVKAHPSAHHLHNPNPPQEASARALHAPAPGIRQDGRPSRERAAISSDRLNAAQPPPPGSPAKPGVAALSKNPANRTSAGGVPKRTSGLQNIVDVNAPNQQMQSQTPPQGQGRTSQAAANLQTSQSRGQQEAQPGFMQKLMKALCCGWLFFSICFDTFSLAEAHIITMLSKAISSVRLRFNELERILAFVFFCQERCTSRSFWAFEKWRQGSFDDGLYKRCILFTKHIL